MNRCPTCGTTYAAEARFCTRDGSKLVARQTMNLATPARGTLSGRAEPAEPVTHTNLVGQVLDGRYQIEKKIGEGGMAFVYLARDVSTQEQYAIKVLSAALSRDQNAMARLKREASLGMRLAHANVCHIIRLGETQDGLVYVFMPFVMGRSSPTATTGRGRWISRRSCASCTTSPPGCRSRTSSRSCIAI
jgi:serine/threonine protein kinase